MESGDVLRGVELLPHPFLRRARDVALWQTMGLLLAWWLALRNLSVLELAAAALITSLWAAKVPQMLVVLRTLRSVRSLRRGARVVAADVARHDFVRTAGPTLWRVGVAFEQTESIGEFPPAAGAPSFVQPSERRIAALVGDDGRVVPISERGYPVFLPPALLERVRSATSSGSPERAPLPRIPGAAEQTPTLTPRMTDPLLLRIHRWIAFALLAMAAWGLFAGTAPPESVAATAAAGAALFLIVRWRSRLRVWFVRADAEGVTLAARAGTRTILWDEILRVVVIGGGEASVLDPEGAAAAVAFAEDDIARRFAWAGIGERSRCRIVLSSIGARREAQCVAPLHAGTTAWIAAEAVARGIDLEVCG